MRECKDAEPACIGSGCGCLRRAGAAASSVGTAKLDAPQNSWTRQDTGHEAQQDDLVVRQIFKKF